MIENNKPQLVKKRKDKKRPGYRGGQDLGAGASGMGSGNTGSSSGGFGGGGDNNARDRAMGLQGKTGKTDKSLDTGGGFDRVDRSKVGQFSQYGKNLMTQNLNPTKTNRFGGILSSLLGLVNPAFGLLAKGLGYLGTKAQDLRGYNPDGSPRTQAEYEAAMRDRQIQGRIDKMTDRMLAGKTFSQKNLDSLLGMKDMFGNPFNTNLGNIDNVRGSNLRGILDSGVPVGIAPMNVNVPTGIVNTDAFNNMNLANMTVEELNQIAGGS